MNSKELQKKYCKNKSLFHDYIYDIKKQMKVDIFSVINLTVISNPYTTEFPKKFFIGEYIKENKFFLFIKSSGKFYLRQCYSLASYFFAFLLFKIYYKKNRIQDQESILIDVFLLVDNIIKDKHFNEKYFNGLYDVLDSYKKKYIYLPRLYNSHKNPFKLIKLFKIINQDKRKFLFEFELVTIKDFIYLSYLILAYPFKTLRLLKKECLKRDALFNQELLKDISSSSFSAFSRYIFGRNIAKLACMERRVYSWSEFQVIERSFNYGVRTQTNKIKLYGCQFYLNYETYFNTYIYDIDFEQKTSYHTVLVNGPYYVKDRKKVHYKNGVSLRYENIFTFSGVKEERDILLLGSYIELDTKYILRSANRLGSVILKNHPVVKVESLGVLSDNIQIVDDDIYSLFVNCKLAIGTASGSVLEAVACGVSVIVVASQSNLTANPLVDYGKGKIWELATTEDEVYKLHEELIKYRNNNAIEIQEIANWYKTNFFIEPTEKNIAKVFGLNKD